jgi:hypothetical protein
MVKNKARDATYTPRTIMDLDLCNYKENKHISRINICVNYKIVINSPHVHFGTTRQHAEVGHKNLIIFSYKNHLDRFCINRKQFI